MANLKNAKKKIRSNVKKTLNNKMVKSNTRNAIKNLEKTIIGNDKKVAQENLLTTIKKIDKTVSKGLIQKNAGARYKSRLTKKVNEMK